MKKNKFFYGEHFEALGIVWDGIYGKAEDFVKKLQAELLKKSKFVFNITTSKYKVGAYNYHNNYFFNILSYLGINDSKECLSLACPILKGIKNNVILKDNYAWKNQIEGVFAVQSQSTNEFILNFYDPLFFANVRDFEFNKPQIIELAGVALCAEKLEEKDYVFTEGNFYERCLEEFLKENPNKTKDDFEPVVIQMRAEDFRMCTGTDEVCIHKIVGLIEDIKYTKILGKKTAILKVNLEHKKDNECLYINIYISEHLLKKYTPKIGEGIYASAWFTGYFIEEQPTIVLKDFWLLFIILALFFAIEIFSTKDNIYTIKPKPPQIEYKQEKIEFKKINQEKKCLTRFCFY